MLKLIGLLIVAILFIDTAVITVAFVRQTSTVTDAEVKAAELQSEISTLKGELVKLRGSLTSLQSRLADSESWASTLETKLTAAKANASALQTDLNTTNAEYARAMQILITNTPARQQGVFINYDPGLGELVPYEYGWGAP